MANTRAQIGIYNAQVLSKVQTLHSDTIDKINKYEDKYMPKVYKYDSM